jgi:hypothetical protein
VYVQAGEHRLRDTSARCNHALVTTRFMSYLRVWRGSNIAFDHVPLFLPDVQLETEAVYVRCLPCLLLCSDALGPATVALLKDKPDNFVRTNPEFLYVHYCTKCHGYLWNQSGLRSTN